MTAGQVIMMARGNRRGLSPIRFSQILPRRGYPSTTVTVLFNPAKRVPIAVRSRLGQCYIRHIYRILLSRVNFNSPKETSSKPALKPVQISLWSGFHGSNRKGKGRLGRDTT